MSLKAKKLVGWPLHIGRLERAPVKRGLASVKLKSDKGRKIQVSQSHAFLLTFASYAYGTLRGKGLRS